MRKNKREEQLVKRRNINNTEPENEQGETSGENMADVEENSATVTLLFYKF